VGGEAGEPHVAVWASGDASEAGAGLADVVGRDLPVGCDAPDASVEQIREPNVAVRPSGHVGRENDLGGIAVQVGDVPGGGYPADLVARGGEPDVAVGAGGECQWTPGVAAADGEARDVAARSDAPNGVPEARDPHRPVRARDDGVGSVDQPSRIAVQGDLPARCDAPELGAVGGEPNIA